MKKKETPKLGRPKLPKGEAKSFTVRARMSPAEFKIVEERAKKAGKPISEWARSILLS